MQTRDRREKLIKAELSGLPDLAGKWELEAVVTVRLEDRGANLGFPTCLL